MYRLVLLLILILLPSCNSNPNKEKLEDQMLMYEPSEMALLMRSMYEVNKDVRIKVINKDSILPFPKDFLNIHSAVLTDPSERNAEFDSLAKQFIYFQEKIYGLPSSTTIANFNKSINTCIACHETRCVGPIPKIKKLLIH